MKYSFLLPAYKGAFLKEALEAIQAQTFEDFEVIVSDDCSPEPVHDIVYPFLSDGRFTYRRNEARIGAEALTSHWNLLLGICKAPYVIVAGDDDVYDTHFLEEIDKRVLQYPEVNLFRARLDKIDKDGIVTEREEPFEAYQDSSQFVFDLFNGRHLYAIGQYVFNTDYLKKAGGFFCLPLAWFSDDATAIITSNRGVVHSSSVLFHARNSGLNISNQPDSIAFMRLKAVSIESFFKWFKSYIKTITRTRPERRLLCKQCRHYCYGRLLNIFYGLPARNRVSVICAFPFFTWTLIKNRINMLIKLCANR